MVAELKATVPSLVADAWHNAPPVLRRFAYWAWGIGAPAAAISVAADLAGWWGNFQFIPNVLSEVISALVTLPIALVIIGQFVDRVLLSARFDSIRQQLAAAARAAREQIRQVTQDVEASTNEFVAAAKIDDGMLADADAATEAARTLQIQMDGRQWVMYERIVTPLRILGGQLQNMLAERDRNGDFTAEATHVARLWVELDSALASQRQIMATGYDVFGQRPALSSRSIARADRLRDLALEHMRGIDRLLDLCQELEYQTDGAPVPSARP